MDAARNEFSLLGRVTTLLLLFGVVALIGWGMHSCARAVEDYRCRGTAAPMGLEGEIKWGLICYVRIGDRWIPKDQVIYDLGGKGLHNSEKR